MFKRPLAIVLILLLSVAGCRKKEDRDDGRVTVVFWHSFVASTVPALNELLAQFEREHPAIHIKAQYIPTGDGLIQKLVTSVQSKTAPDVSWIHADFLDKLVDADAIYPVSHFAGGPDGLSSTDMEDIFPACLEAGRYRGIQYALPMEATSLALLYNRGLFSRAGLDPDHPPQDWKELRSYARRLTVDIDGNGTTDQYGFLVPVFPASGELNIWMILQWTPFLWQAGGEEIRADQSEVLFNSEAGVQALTLWKTMYDELDVGKFGIAHDLGFASQKLAMVLDGPWNLPRYRAMKDVDWAVAPLPAGPVGRATYIAGEQLAVFKQSEHPAEAWAFVRWILSPSVQAKFSMASGYLPVRRSVLSMKEYQDFLAGDPPLRAFVEQMKVGRARQAIDRHRVEINRALAEALEKSIVGKMDPKSCLDDAAKTANALLQQGGGTRK